MEGILKEQVEIIVQGENQQCFELQEAINDWIINHKCSPMLSQSVC